MTFHKFVNGFTIVGKFLASFWRSLTQGETEGQREAIILVLGFDSRLKLGMGLDFGFLWHSSCLIFRCFQLRGPKAIKSKRGWVGKLVHQKMLPQEWYKCKNNTKSEQTGNKHLSKLLYFMVFKHFSRKVDQVYSFL
jgi:hypothetical protein